MIMKFYYNNRGILIIEEYLKEDKKS